MSYNEIEEITKIKIPSYPNVKVNNPNIMYMDPEEMNTGDNINISDENDKFIKTDISMISCWDISKINEFINDLLNNLLSVNGYLTIDKIIYTSENGRKYLSIYSDKELNTKYHENVYKIKDVASGCIKSDVNDILKNVDKVINEKVYCPENSVNVLDLMAIYSKYMQSFDATNESTVEAIKNKVESLESYNSPHVVGNIHFRYDSCELDFTIYEANLINVGEFKFKVHEDGKVVPINFHNQKGIQVYQHLKEELYNYVKFHLDNKPLLDSKNNITIPTINSDCIIDLSFDKMNITYSLESTMQKNLFSITYETKDPKKFVYDYKEISLLEHILLDNNIENIFANTFVKIEDCPTFIQQQLYDNINNCKENVEVSQVEEKITGKQKLKSLFNKFSK